MLRDAKQYLERAKSLNSDDLVASAWLEKVNRFPCNSHSQNLVTTIATQIPTLVRRPQQTPSDDEQDDDIDNQSSSGIHVKRARMYSPESTF